MAGPLGVNKINALMKTMAAKGGLKGRYTNHSGRKTMMQELVQNNVPPTQIIQLSGHKNLQSVNNYSQVSVEQQQNMSRILSNLTNFEEATSSRASSLSVKTRLFRLGSLVIFVLLTFSWVNAFGF